TYTVVAHWASADPDYLDTDSAPVTFTISPRTLHVTATAQDKVYDGTTTATVMLSDDRVVDDPKLSLSWDSADFADKGAGAAKVVTVVGLVLDGPYAFDYVLDSSTVTTTASITPRPLTVTATGIDKVYDGTTAAKVTFSDDPLPGDVVTPSAMVTFAD